MRFFVGFPRGLISLACVAGLSAPVAAATSNVIGGDEVSLHIDGWLQTRAEHADAADSNGAIFDPLYGRDGQTDEANLDIRRAHLVVGGSYRSVYRFAVALADDNGAGQYGSASRQIALYKAWVDRDFILGAQTHTLHGGLDYPFFNRAYGGSPYDLFPQARATGALLGYHGVGLRYRVTGDAFDLGIDVQNNLGGGKPAQNAGQRGGLCFSGRLEVSALKGPKPAYKESYAGEDGKGLILAADAVYDDRDTGTPGFLSTGLGYGIEGLGHLDQISILVEGRWAQINHDSTTFGTASTYSSQRVIVVQAGVAVPFYGTMALEPALRGQWMDFGTGTGTVNYDDPAHPDAEWGGTGVQYDVGLNLYLNRHASELQLSFSHWRAQDGNGRADIWRLQHQLFF